MLVHTVYFWIKDATAPAAVDALAKDCREMLGRIPTVRQIWAGKPAGTPRGVVDNTYAVGLTVVFDDLAGHDVYQEHPIHKEFIARHNAIWARVVVYDFMSA